MSIFDDKKLNEFDELTQLIEPFVFPVNAALNKFPKEVILDYDDICNLNSDGDISGTIYMSTLLTNIDSKLKLDIGFNINHDDNFKNKFELEIIGGTTIDYANGILTGEIKLKKQDGTYSDKEIKDIMINEFSQRAFSGIRKQKDAPASRFAELAETCGILSGMKQLRGFGEKKRFIQEHLKGELESNKVRIRDVSLASKYGRWINKYLRDGNMTALKNIALLRIMSYSDKAIYSIQEEQI